jgi:hypothetical protein
MRFMKELSQIDGGVFRKIVVENVCEGRTPDRTHSGFKFFAI